MRLTCGLTKRAVLEQCPSHPPHRVKLRGDFARTFEAYRGLHFVKSILLSFCYVEARLFYECFILGL